MPHVDRSARYSEYRVWGLGQRGTPLEIYDPARFPAIAQVIEHLGGRLLEIRGEGEPIQIALAEGRRTDDPDAVNRRFTPFFSSLTSLDFFCKLNLQTYLSVDSDTAPRRWFWQEETQAGYRSSGVGSIVNETSVSIARSAGH